MILALVLAAQFWTSFMPSPRPAGAILEGMFVSCPIEDELDEYEERIYDQYDRTTRKPAFELHMGPRDAFTLFPGVQDAHRAHGTGVALTYGTQTVRGYTVEIRRLDGARSECFTTYLKITTKNP